VKTSLRKSKNCEVDFICICLYCQLPTGNLFHPAFLNGSLLLTLTNRPFFGIHKSLNIINHPFAYFAQTKIHFEQTLRFIVQVLSHIAQVKFSIAQAKFSIAQALSHIVASLNDIVLTLS
jgi:hypothetical protein